MCFARGRTIRRLSNGRLVQERVRSTPTKLVPTPVPIATNFVPIPGSALKSAPRAEPVRTPEPIPAPRAVTNKANNHPPAVAPEKKRENEESYLDVFAGLSCPQKQSADTQNGNTIKGQKKANLTPSQTQSASASYSSDASSTSQVKPPKQDVFPKLKKKVSFPPNLTRGKDRSYSPPLSDQREVRFSEDNSEEEKSVRFSDELIRGKGPEYSSVTPSKSEKYPFFTAAFGSRKKQRQTSPPAPLKSSIADRKASKIEKKKATMGGQKYGKAREELEEFNGLSDSDSSFTEFASGAQPTIENEQSGRKPTTTSRGQSLRVPTSSSVPLKYVPGRGWIQRGDTQSETRTMESYVEYVTARNTQLNQASERNIGLERAEQERRHGTAPIPDHNSYGFRIRPDAADFHTLHGTASSHWPLPVFVRRGSGDSTGPDRPQPNDVLGERSSARHKAGDANQRATTGTKKGASAGPSQQASSRKESGRSSRRSHQPRSYVEDDVDDNVYYDPASRRTYRDV
ncbi:MAG: hypothetical protein L6R37_002135 [Teloschistes peruensis]|nr:MAG: hypothetical protein L6R37_002135 [Teloschistes peruensis]